MARKQQVADNTHPTYDIMNRTMSSPFLMLSWQQNKINLYLTGVETLFKIIIELINVMFFHLGWNIRTKTDFFFRWTLFSYWWSKWNSLIRFRLKRGNYSCRGTEQVLPESHGNQTGEQSWWDVNSGTQCESSWSGTYSTHSQTIDHPDHCNVKQIYSLQVILIWGYERKLSWIVTYFESMLRKEQRTGVESLVSWVKTQKTSILIKQQDLK